MKKFTFEIYFKYLKSRLIEVTAENNVDAILEVMCKLDEEQQRELTRTNLLRVY